MTGFDALTLECFIAAAETGGFTRAGYKINRTQSAVSQQIAKLEQQLGKTLFNRGKILTLTHDGELFLSYAKKIISLNREALDRFREPDVEGEIRIGMPDDFASVFLSELLPEYVSIHPRILLYVDCDLTLNLYERFKQNEFDLVVVKMNKVDNYAHEIFSEPLEWVGNKEFFHKSHTDPIPLVISPDPCVYRARAITALEKANKSWRTAFSSHSYAGKIAAVKAGMGVTVLPRNMIPKDVPIIHRSRSTPSLHNTHICLLKRPSNNPAVDSIESYILEKLQ